MKKGHIVDSRCVDIKDAYGFIIILLFAPHDVNPSFYDGII